MAPPSGEILFLAHRIPFPPDRGDKIRSHHILKALADIAPVHVGCFADDDRDRGFAEAMARLTASQHVAMRDRSRVVAGLSGLLRRRSLLVSLYEDGGLRHWVGETLASRPIQAVVAYSVQMARYVPRDLPKNIRFLMDFVDFDSAKYAAYGAWGRGPMAWINRREGRLLMDFERETALRADMSTFVSDAEADLFMRMAGLWGKHIRALENGVDLEFFKSSAAFDAVAKREGPLIVFTGQMDYRPNIDAVTSFAHETLPLVRQVHPAAAFAVVGRNPAAEVDALARLPGVIVTGPVPDVRGWLAASDVVVAPLRIARGVQNKVLEAMAMGRPVVASAEAAEGIDARDGEHLMIAHGPAEEAAMILSLLSEPARATAIGQAARKQVEARYSWNATLAPLRHMLFGGL